MKQLNLPLTKIKPVKNIKKVKKGLPDGILNDLPDGVLNNLPDDIPAPNRYTNFELPLVDLNEED